MSKQKRRRIGAFVDAMLPLWALQVACFRVTQTWFHSPDHNLEYLR